MPCNPKCLATGWTKDEIQLLLRRNDHAVGRALVALLDRQTNDERLAGTTKHVNGRGFNSADAEPMTSMARFYMQRGNLTYRQLNWLRDKNRIAKYAGQLVEVANAKMEHRLLAEEAELDTVLE